ncbi:ABC transporter ATP-binding protein [Taibaiella helva]|uniref:ABC transporter ATP-binding protein n=1 Tax=Taibaiella helva TaxID=2301235 RepID=UPI000E56B4E6|nr:ABC transporter ATP-binding protein [Taibaiella helva]
MLSARQLSKKYGQLTVLNHVTLDIHKGEFVAIAGPSGAGKSTLLHLLGALDFPDKGQVKLMDQELFRLSRKKQAAFRNKHMGFVFQFHHLLPEFTALENVCMPLWIGKQPKDEAIAAAKEILKTVGLGHRMEHKPSELSGGEQQRVAIARAIVHRPSVIFADEPTGNLDTANAQAVHELFFQLRALYQQTFVIVTHNEQLAAMADRTLMMKDGKIVAERLREDR